MLVAGIDGGQSSTVAAIADGNGRILARGSAGPADEIGATAESTRLHDALAGALHDAMRNAGLPHETQFDAIVAGISGYEGTVFGIEPVLPSTRVHLMHDAPVAYAGALGGATGAIVIAGTGSIACARAADGRERCIGGWGYLFGDEGSAFWIARSAVSAAAAHESCSGTEALLSFFDVHSMRELVRGFYVGKIARDDLASFAPLCIDAASRGEGCTCMAEPAAAGAAALAKLCSEAVFDPGEPFSVAFTGGLMRSAWYKERTYAALRERFSAMQTAAYRILEPAHEPVLGAVLLALNAAGVASPAIA